MGKDASGMGGAGEKGDEAAAGAEEGEEKESALETPPVARTR